VKRMETKDYTGSRNARVLWTSRKGGLRWQAVGGYCQTNSEVPLWGTSSRGKKRGDRLGTVTSRTGNLMDTGGKWRRD